MMKIKVFVLILMLSSFAGSVYCQTSDFGIWYEANVEKSLGKKFELSGSLNVRTFEDASTIDKAFAEFGGSYDPNRYIGFAGSYRIGRYLEKDDLYHPGQQFFADIKGSLPVSDLEFSTRLRLQVTERTNVKHETGETSYDGRIKLKCRYRIPHFPVDPYLSFETFTPLFRSSGQFIAKSRSSAGFDYKISKKHLLEAEYTYQRDNTPHLKIAHLVTLGYTFRF